MAADPLVAHALLRAASTLVSTPLDREKPLCPQEQETAPDGNVSGTTNLAGVVIRSRRVLVAHALLRAVSALSTNLGANRWKQRRARSRGLWRQRRSRQRSSPALADTSTFRTPEASTRVSMRQLKLAPPPKPHSV